MDRLITMEHMALYTNVNFKALHFRAIIIRGCLLMPLEVHTHIHRRMHTHTDTHTDTHTHTHRQTNTSVKNVKNYKNCCEYY